MANNKDFLTLLREVRGSGAPGTAYTDGIWYELAVADTNGNPGIYGDILAKYGVVVENTATLDQAVAIIDGLTVVANPLAEGAAPTAQLVGTTLTLGIPVGATGVQGLIGPKGLTGATGAKGDTGLTGPAGVDGLDGHTPTTAEVDAVVSTNVNVQAAQTLLADTIVDATIVIDATADGKIAEYDANAADRVQEYDANHVIKLGAYNSNDTLKIDQYNANHIERLENINFAYADRIVEMIKTRNFMGIMDEYVAQTETHMIDFLSTDDANYIYYGNGVLLELEVDYTVYDSTTIELIVKANPYDVIVQVNTQVLNDMLTAEGVLFEDRIGQPNGVAGLDANGTVPSAQLPSYVDDVIEVATYAELPVTGEIGKIYVVVADETSGGDTSSYRWTGTIYAMVSNTLTAADVKALYEANLDTNAYTDAEKAKVGYITVTQAVDLDTIESDTALNNAKVTNVTTDLGITVTATTNTITSSDGIDATITAATITDAGLLTAADKSKLDGVATGATANSSDAVLLARANHTGTQLLTTITPDNLVGVPTDINDMTKLFNHVNSSGVMYGCELIDNGDGSVNITAGYAMLRATADGHSTLYKIEVPAQTNLILLEGVNYISLNWNAGSPIFTTSALESSFNCLNICIAYVAVREGVAISYINATEQNVDSNRKTRRLFLQFSRFIHLGAGSKLGNAGALAISVTEGKFNFMLEELSHTAFDTSVAGTANENVFDVYHRNGTGGWIKTVDQKVVNTTTYDNGTGTLATLGNNKYGITWFYMILNNPSHLVAIKGQAEYPDSSSADVATPPVAVPAVIEGLGVLLGYVTYKKNDTEIEKAFSAFTQTFRASQAVAHNGLSGLQGGAVNDYQHLTTAQLDIVNTTSGVNTGDQTDITGNAGTVTNGVYTTDIGATVQAYNADTVIDANYIAYTQTEKDKVANIPDNTDLILGTTTLTRFDKILGSMNIVDMEYTSGDLVTVRYAGDNDTNVFYRDVLAYVTGDLVTVKHYCNTADLVTESGLTTLAYDVDKNLVSSTYTEV